MTEFFAIMGHFVLFDPPNNSKNPNFEKMVKKSEDLSFSPCVPFMKII